MYSYDRGTKWAAQGILLQRVGGLSPVRQDNAHAPVSHGVWAFIWPFADLFFLSSTGPEGRTKPGQKAERLKQVDREGFRRFVHTGPLYTRYHVPHSRDAGNGWYLTDGETLAAFVRKHVHEAAQDLREALRGDSMGWEYPLGQKPFANISGRYSRDNFEVFVPRPSEKAFPEHLKRRQKERPRWDADL